MRNLADLHKSQLHGLINLLGQAFSDLSVRIDAFSLETLCSCIFNVMNARWRKYHTIEHVYDLCDTQDPIEILAGAYHDMVYLQVDRRIHPKISVHLMEFLEFDDDYTIQTVNHGNDLILRIADKIFGISPGAQLGPMTGANEYLSAITGARILSSYLGVWNTVQLIACIELTRPFRKSNDRGEAPPQQLERRIRELLNEIELKVSEQDIQQAILRAVRTGNRDVKSFSNELGIFQTNTWSLILEGNPVFKNPMFTISQYRTALLRVERFYTSLDTRLIYQHYGDSKELNSEIDRMRQKAEKNIQVSIEYYRMRLCSVAIFEAIAERTGGEAPLMLFTGNVTPESIRSRSLVEHFLDPKIAECHPSEYNLEALPLFNQGIYDALGSELKNQTISSYLYVRTSQQEREKIYANASLLFEKKLDSIAYLKSLRMEIGLSVLDAVYQMVISRRKQISDLRNILTAPS